MRDRLTTREAAALIGVTPNTLDVWRCRNVGPPYFKLTGLIRYDKAELLKWSQSQRHVPARARVKITAASHSRKADASVTA
jgi:hypothetical protein